jgi:hypothetical protein
VVDAGGDHSLEQTPDLLPIVRSEGQNWSDAFLGSFWMVGVSVGIHLDADPNYS